MDSRIDQEILRLDVSVANSEGVDVSESAVALVGVKFDEQDLYWLLHFIIVLEHSVDCLRDIVHYHIEIDLIFLEEGLL
jgi:hypothetical protein